MISAFLSDTLGIVAVEGKLDHVDPIVITSGLREHRITTAIP
jgi:hypothetical protein